MALTEAELVTPGSGYGAFRKDRARTGHLEFVKKTESMEKWEHFFETGELHCPDPEAEPDAFWSGEEFLAYLKQTTLKPLAPNCENWYAYYHLGILEFRKGNDKIAKEMYETSLKLQENAWALHGLACLCIHEGNKILRHCMHKEEWNLRDTVCHIRKKDLKF